MSATTMVPRTVPIRMLNPDEMDQVATPLCDHLKADEIAMTVLEFLGVMEGSVDTETIWSHIEYRARELRRQGKKWVFAHCQSMPHAFFTDLKTAILTENTKTIGHRPLHFRLPGVASDMAKTASALESQDPHIIDVNSPWREGLISLDAELDNYGRERGECARVFFKNVVLQGVVGVLSRQFAEQIVDRFLRFGSRCEWIEEGVLAKMRDSIINLKSPAGRCTLFAFNAESIQIVYRAHAYGTICPDYRGKHPEGLQVNAEGRLPSCSCDDSMNAQARVLAGALPDQMHNVQMLTYDTRTFFQRRQYEQVVLAPLARALRRGGLWNGVPPSISSANANAAATPAKKG